MSLNIFWFRRDLRLSDNHGLHEALIAGKPVLPVFIFDENIIHDLKRDDKRIIFIYRRLQKINSELEKIGSRLIVKRGTPENVFLELIDRYNVSAVYANADYEPYAVKRDSNIKALLSSRKIGFFTFKDQLIFEPGEIVKPDGSLYEIFTPFSRKWLSLFHQKLHLEEYKSEQLLKNLTTDIYKETRDNRAPGGDNRQLSAEPFISIEELGFSDNGFEFPDEEIPVEKIREYDKTRDYPAIDGTTRLGIHLRFGTISIRECVKTASEFNQTWLNELIWREFFMHVLAYFPRVVDTAFKVKYDNINWRNNEDDFARWCNGTTGYPLVDAGMRQMLQTGFMHNRVRMVTASFLTKHLLIDWRWGEAFFAEHLLDYELASNNGNWQWAAGCGCDAVPYFRIFNPTRQQEKFDKDLKYVRQWVPEYGTSAYPEPVVEHEFARERCLDAYRKALNY